jgi:hypothetical protein
MDTRRVSRTLDADSLERRGLQDADGRPAGSISVRQIPSVSRQRWRVAQAERILAASRAHTSAAPEVQPHLTELLKPLPATLDEIATRTVGEWLRDTKPAKDGW